MNCKFFTFMIPDTGDEVVECELVRYTCSNEAPDNCRGREPWDTRSSGRDLIS